MTRVSKTLLLLVALALATRGVAFADPAGFAFLEIPTGARASSLGGAYGSIGEGVESIYWNPAGLEGVQKAQITGGHSELMQALRHDYFAAGWRMWGGGVAASVRALYSEPIEERDENGTQIGTFGAHDLEFALGYARAVGAGLRVGGSAQAVRERISNLAATTYAFALGGTWDPETVEGLRVSLAAQNLGPAASYDIDGVAGEPISLPVAVQTGGSYRFDLGNVGVKAALEERLTRGRSGVTMIGLELGSGGASIRGGARMNDDASTMSLGAGYVLGALKLDYAFVPMSLDLGDTHRFSFSAQF